MLPIKIENGMASLIVHKTKRLTPRQLMILKHTEERQGVAAHDQYLSTLLGLAKGPVSISRPRVSRWHVDRLANKDKGEILRQFKALLYNADDADHKPSKRNVGEWIGVEIECFYPSDERECTDECDHENGECFAQHSPDEDVVHHNIKVALERAKIPRASVKYDGSLVDDEGVGVEVTLLFNTTDGYKPLERLCKILNDMGCYVNDSCGLHIHLDARHLKNKGAKIIGKRLGRALPVLKYIVDPKRHDNTYCKMAVSPFCRSSEQRYHAINLTSFFKYKTIEVRMHGGSTNPRKIKNWIELIRFISSVRIPKQFTTFQQLIDLGTPEHLVEYADKRITRLNPTAWPKLMPVEPVIESQGASVVGSMA